MVTIGITGHRLLADEDKISGALDYVLENIRQIFPDQSYTLLSPLAAGGDQLAAECALQYGMHLVVPLPLPIDDYLNDFTTQESKQGFLNLLNKADRVIDLPLQATRNASYKAVGRYILEHCNVLIAIWDGKDAQGQGGTGDIVTEWRQRGMPLAWIHAGNRKPGTTEPTNLGDQQGMVGYENFPTNPVINS